LTGARTHAAGKRHAPADHRLSVVGRIDPVKLLRIQMSALLQHACVTARHRFRWDALRAVTRSSTEDVVPHLLSPSWVCCEEKRAPIKREEKNLWLGGLGAA
jgi:hypothetical protein